MIAYFHFLLIALAIAEPFQPTVVPSQAKLKSIYQNFNAEYGRSTECSHRAHIWAYEMFKNHGIYSQKIFIFFTASYIRRHQFKWWFHVAPLVLVDEQGIITPKVLDFMFDHEPKSIKSWTDNFVFSNRPCKYTEKFSEYDVNPQIEDCYYMISPMYDWMPRDLIYYEQQGIRKNTFNSKEIQISRTEAFP